MNALSRRLPRVLRANQWLVVGSMTLVMLASMLYASMNGLLTDLDEGLAHFRSASQMETASFLPQRPLADLSAFEKAQGVTIEARRETDIAVDARLTLRILARTSRVDIPVVTRGRALSADNELLLGETVALADHIRLGSSLTLAGRSFTVVGFTAVPDYLYPIRTTDDAGILLDPTAFGIAVVTPGAMDRLAPHALTTYHLLAAADRENSARLALAGTVGLSYWQDLATNPRYTIALAKLKGATAVSTTIPLVILLLTSLLLAAAQGRMVRMQRSQLGMLKALGYSTRELVQQELALPAIIACAGAAMGLLSALLAMRPLLGFMARYFSIPVDRTTIPLKACVLSLAVPAAFLIPAVALVAVLLLRQRPVTLMRTTVTGRRPSLLERSLHLSRGTFRSRFAIRTAVRGLTRLALLLLGAMIAGYLLLFGGAMMDSMQTLIRGAFQDTKYAYTYLLTVPQENDPWGGEPLTVTSFATTDGKLDFQVLGLPQTTTLLTVHDTSGRVVPVDRIYITQPLAQKLGLHIGDRWTMRQATSEKDVTLPVDGIAEMYTTAAVLMPQNQLNRLAGLPSGSFNALFSRTALRLPAGTVLTTLSVAASKAAFHAATGPLWVTCGSIAVIAIIIALLALSVVTALAVEEERLSISLLKVLGYRDDELSRMVLGSGIVALLAGFLLSIPLLLGSLQELLASATANISFSLPIRLSPLSIVLALAALLGTYLVSLRSARRRILDVPMAVSLKAARE